MQALDMAVSVLKEYISERRDEIDDALKFSSDTLALYLINAEEHSVVGYNDKIFRDTITDMLDDQTLQRQAGDVDIHDVISQENEHINQLIHRDRRYSVSSMANPYAPITEYPKSQELFDFLYEILMQTRLITRIMTEEQLQRLVRTMHPETVSAGEQLITQGDYGKTMYLIESGEFDIIKNGIPSARLGAKTLFGEISLLYNFPRTATVLCVQDAQVWVANSDAYTAILMTAQRKNRETMSKLLERNKKYACMTIEEKDLVLRAAHILHFSKGEKIVVKEKGKLLSITSRAEVLLSSGAIHVAKQGDLVGQGAIAASPLSLLFIPEHTYGMLEASHAK